MVGICLMWLLPCVSSFVLSGCISSSTPGHILQMLTAASSARDYQVFTTFLASSQPILVGDSADLVLDYVYEEELSLRLERESPRGRYYLMWRRESRSTQGTSEAESYKAAFIGFISSLKLGKLLLLSDSQPHHLALTSSLLETPFIHLNREIVPYQSDLEFSLQFVGRRVKPSGSNIIALFTDPVTAYNFLQAFQQKRMDKAGYAYILAQEAAQYRYLPYTMTGLLASGVLLVGEKALEARSFQAYEELRLQQLVGELTTHESFPLFLYCLFSSIALEVASSLTYEVNTTRLLYPGQVSAIPHQTAVIRASVNYNLTNPDGSLFPQSHARMRGFQVAFEEVHRRKDIAPNYYLEDYNVNIAGIVYNYNVTKARLLRAKGQLGVIYFTTPASAPTLGIYSLLGELGMRLPLAGGSYSSVLSSTALYPYFLRARVASGYIYRTMCTIMQHFKWTQVAVLYSADNGDNEDSYRQLLAWAPQFGIQILNSEAGRRLPNQLNDTTADLVKAALEEIRALDTRIIVQITVFAHVIADVMASLDMQSEYLLVLGNGLADANYQGAENAPRRLVTKGALWFAPRTFVGAVGKRVQSALLRSDGAGLFPVTCFFYDIAYLYFFALDYLLASGQDYESADTLLKAMRESHFQGCGGLVRIEAGSNDRDSQTIDIFNFQYYEGNDSHSVVQVGTYNAFSTQPIALNTPIQWPDGAASFPYSKPRYENCPYYLSQVQAAKYSRIIAFVVLAVTAALTALASALMWQRWWRSPLPQLTEKQPIQLEDVLVLSTVAWDFLQLAAMGPDFSNLSEKLQMVSASVGLDLDSVINLTQGIYWVVLDCVLGGVVLYLLISVLKLTKGGVWITHLWSSFHYWSDLVLPSLGNLLFLPIVSTLTQVFLCSKASGPAFTSSFLNKDCYEHCWSGSHLGYCIGSAVALVLYIPVATYTRPLWQELQTNGSLKASPPALMIKSAFQVFLIVSVGALKREFPGVHAGFYLVSVTGYIGFMWKWRQFNYERLNLWQWLGTVAALCLGAAGYLSQTLLVNRPVELLAGLAVVYALLAAAGLAIQLFFPRFSSKLTRQKAKDIKHLLVFAFSKGARASEALRLHYSVNQGAPYMAASAPPDFSATPVRNFLV